MRHGISLGDRIRYAIDSTFARGSGALVLWLFALSLVIVLLAASAASLLGIAPAGEPAMSFAEAAWASLMRALDSGTMGGDQGWAFRILMLLVTLGGIFVISALIGALSSGIDARLADMRKGRSRIVEQGHTVILGWSPQVFTIIEELVEANRNQRRPAIAVLADADKVAMEDAIRAKVGPLRNTRVICRTGDPLDPADLEIVGVDRSRAIIVLSEDPSAPDAETIKTILAITRRPDRRSEPYHIVAEIRNAKNVAAARIAGRDEVELLVVGDLIASVVAQTCRQAGLSTVYSELLDFEGDEIYFATVPELVGQRFGDCLLEFEDAALIGLQPEGQRAQLRPDMDRRLEPGDRLVAIAADDDRILRRKDAPPPIDPSAIRSGLSAEPLPETTLILGWNWRGAAIARELDHYVPAGSELVVVAAKPIEQIERSAIEAELRMQQVSFHRADVTDRDVLDEVMQGRFDHVIVLSDRDGLPAGVADARTLMTLIHLRDIAQIQGVAFSTVTEINDLRNQRLAEITGVDDFIVSDHLLSLVLAQVSENKGLAAVLGDLFDPESGDIRLEPAASYVEPGRELSFATVVEAARQQGQIAIGYRLLEPADATALGHGVVINPAKSSRVRFGDEDRVIVLGA